MKLRFYLFIVIFISFINAQQFDLNNLPKIGILKGSVIDSTSGEPLEYASVSLISQRTNEIVTGGITDALGKFYIKQIPIGRYKVSIEYIGYNRSEQGQVTFNPRENVTEIDLGIIKLEQSALAYQTVEVEGEKPLFVQTMEKKIFNVEQNTISSGGSALDALRQVPGVDVDNDGNVSLRGSSKVNFLIDGKPALMSGGDAATLLENIPSDNISDIEVVTNPSAKYDPEGMAGIINVVLKENRLVGFSGNIKSGSNTLGSYNSAGQLNYRNEKINLFTNFGLRNNVRGIIGETYRETYYDDYTNYLDQTIDGEKGGGNIFMKGGAEYFINSKNIFGLNITYSDGNRIHDQTVITYEMDEEYLEYESVSEGDRDSKKFDVIADYVKKFNDPSNTLNVNLLFSNSNNTTEDFDFIIPLSGYENIVATNSVQSITDNQFNTIDFQLDYVQPIRKNTKLELGYKGTDRSIDNLFESYNINDTTGISTLNVDEVSHFLYNETIHAGYGVFSSQRGLWGLQLGLRGELVETMSELVDTEEQLENPYVSFFPSLALSVGPQQVFQVQASYSKRINRPSYRNLDPSLRTLDQYTQMQGNPFLRPEYIDIAELNFFKFSKGLSISLGSYYRHVVDKISKYKYVDERGVSISTFENLDSQDTYGVELIVSGSIGSKFRIMLNGNLFTDEVNASSVFDEYDKTSTGFMGRMTGTWKINPTTEFMLMGFYRSPRDIPIGKMESMAFASLSGKKKFLEDRLAISLNINDIFDTMDFGYETFDENYYQDSWRKFNSQAIGIQIQYTFGSMEDRGPNNRKRKDDNLKDDGDIGDYEIE